MLQVKSKYKICKRLGSGVFEQCQTQRFTLAEARSGKQKTGRRGQSDYGQQLIEKQKVRFTYGLSERQLSRYVREANETSDPASALHKALEMRLDNVIYRAGLASTRRAARQMASHGHVLVNNSRMTVPSHRLRVGDQVSVRESSRASALFTGKSEEGQRGVPAWISFDMSKLSGSIVGEPAYQTGENLLDYAAVFEFYSR